MKSTSIKILVVVCLLALTATATLYGCGGSMATPELSVIGSTLYWNSVGGAASYEVYRNGNLVATVTGNYYVVSNNNATAQFYIVAKDAEGTRSSGKSRSVAVYKQSGFTDSEKMEINLNEQDGGYTVPAEINHVKVTGKSSYAYITLTDRTTDLVVELNNVDMVSPDGKSCIMTSDGKFDTETKKFAVTVIVSGTNVLTGGDCSTKPAQPSTNSGKKGAKGIDGGCGILLPQVVIVGDGSLTLKGGKGGPGGTGADSAGWSTARYGNGGNGGNGGSGIKATAVVMAMSTSGVIKAYGGAGGTKGSPGSNGSIVSGPWNTSGWSSSYGDNGAEGTGMQADLKQLGGTLITE